MSKSRQKGNRLSLTISLIAVTLFNLLFLYFSKYKNHGIPISEFSLSIGNFLNLLFALFLISGLILAHRSRTKIKGVISFIILMTVFLLSTSFINLLSLPLPEYYLFNHPVEDILIVSLFISYQFTQFIAVSLLWSKLRDRDTLLFLKAILNSTFLFIILFVFAYIFSKKEVQTGVKESNFMNVGVVLGAAVWSYDKPSHSLAARIDKAVELHNSGLIQKIQVTGSNAPGELSEAEVSFRYIIDKGIGPEDIYFENQTGSTSEQVKYLKEVLLKKNKNFNIVIISDRYHLPRIREITQFYNINTDLAASRLTLNEKDLLYYYARESIGLVIFWLFAL